MSDWLRRLLIEWRVIVARDAPAPLQALTLLHQHVPRRDAQSAVVRDRKDAA